VKRETFNVGFTAMVKTYAYVGERADVETMDVYWEMLQGLPDEAFNSAVRACLSECKFFPTIAELGEAALPVNGLGYNWRQQIERKARRVAIEGDPRVGKLIGSITKGTENAAKVFEGRYRDRR